MLAWSFWGAEKKLRMTCYVHIFTEHTTWRLHGGNDGSHLARCITDNGYPKTGTETVKNTNPHL